MKSTSFPNLGTSNGDMLTQSHYVQQNLDLGINLPTTPAMERWDMQWALEDERKQHTLTHIRYQEIMRKALSLLQNKPYFTAYERAQLTAECNILKAKMREMSK